MDLELYQHPFDMEFENATADARSALRAFWLVHSRMSWLYV